MWRDLVAMETQSTSYFGFLTTASCKLDKTLPSSRGTLLSFVFCSIYCSVELLQTYGHVAHMQSVYGSGDYETKKLVLGSIKDAQIISMLLYIYYM